MSGYPAIVWGAVESTNAPLQVVCGFQPRSVKLYLADGASGFWNDSMDDDAAFKRIVAGTGSFVTTNGITPDSNGFTLGADANLNPASATIIYFEALQ